LKIITIYIKKKDDRLSFVRRKFVRIIVVETIGQSL